MRILGSPSRAEPVAWTLALAVLAQLCFAAPLALAMSPAGTLAAATCDGGEEHEVPAPPASHDHAQCLLCTGGVGPLLATPTLPLLAPPAAMREEKPASIAGLREVPSASSYLSRAPPPVRNA